MHLLYPLPISFVGVAIDSKAYPKEKTEKLPSAMIAFSDTYGSGRLVFTTS
jgi:hypothetical protein